MRRVDGYTIQITGEQSENISDDECRAYIEHAKEKLGAFARHLNGLELHFDGDFVDITYGVPTLPFNRIRRITGYLVGDLSRFNNGKRAEEHDRVKHGISAKENAKVDTAAEEPQAIYR